MPQTLAPSQQLEQTLRSRGFLVVAGIDEVGRGSWAGPVVAAAVILPSDCRLDAVRDSKLLSGARRRQLVAAIQTTAVDFALGWATSQEVDTEGLTAAVRLSGLRALAGLKTAFDFVILDGKHNYLVGHHPAEASVKADQTSLNVAAASILAKVARDDFMIQADVSYPGYGFANHKGYGTAAHRSALTQGLSPLHRRSYLPLRAIEPKPEAQSVN